MTGRPHVELLDCTLRDASYPIAYQLTAEDTAIVAAGLEDAGFRRIEVGHGLGLGASTPALGVAAASDREYLEAAASVLTRARFGAFFIPGIAADEHLKLAARCGCGFIRIGTNANQTETAERYVKLAKTLGLEVSCNLMKTYAVDRDDILRRSEALVRWGADVVCVVDSAGGMLPEDVRGYVSVLRSRIDAVIGFHGHNNLQLAIANTLAAIDSGATVVDCTLRGMGRSSGNAQTEVLIAILKRMGFDLPIDVYKTMDLGDKVIAPLARGRGVDSVELACGYAMLHSGHLDALRRVANETGVDLRELIVQVGEIDKIDVTEELMARVARSITARPRHDTRTSSVDGFTVTLAAQKSDADGAAALARRIASEIETLSKKTGRLSIFTIAARSHVTGQPASFPFIRGNAAYVIGNAEIDAARQAKEIGEAIDGRVDYVLADAESTQAATDLLEELRGVVRTSGLLAYRDANAHVDAAEALVGQLCRRLLNARVAVCGVSGFGLRLAQRLVERGARVFLWDVDEARATRAVSVLSSWMDVVRPGLGPVPELLRAGRDEIDIVIGAGVKQPSVTAAPIDCVVTGGLVLDAGVGSLAPEAIARAEARGLSLYRLDMRAGLDGQVSLALGTRHLLERVLGRGEVAGVSVLAGGVIGPRGTIVLDAMQQPTRVIGVADGKGHLLDDVESEEYENLIVRVKADLLRSRLP